MPLDYARLAADYQREAERQEREIARLKKLYGRTADSEINKNIAVREEILHEARSLAREMRRRAGITK